MILHATANKIVAAICCALALLAPCIGRARVEGSSAAGAVVITNRAEASFTDNDGASFLSVSSTITITVRPVSALVVTPDETTPSTSVSPRERITRLFRICNTGNTPDLYTITRAEASAPATLAALYFDLDASGTHTDADAQITVGTTLSPRLAPGACVGVLAVVDTNDSPTNSRLNITLTARSNTDGVNGLAQDNGTIINSVGKGVRFTSPTNAAQAPTKLVENQERVTATPGQLLNYTIVFRNSGDVPARAALIRDELPAGLSYVPGSLRLGARALTDADDADEGRVRLPRQIEIRLNEVAPDEVVRVAFQVRLADQIPAGTGALNYAFISADNSLPVQTTGALVIVDPLGTIYAGRSGGSATINSAQVSLLVDQSSQTPLNTTPDIGFTPNAHNANPFITEASGHFNFALTPAQIGSPAQPARYFLHVIAQGYRSRLLELSLHPAGSGLYDSTVRALDGQPIARVGSFELTDEAITLNSLAALALNVPMFENSALEVLKSADQPRAEIGDVVSYRVEVHNPTVAAVDDVIVRDTLPQSFHYAQGTARLEAGRGAARAIEPEIGGNALVFRLGTLASGARATITYRVRIGVNARVGENFNSAAVEGRDALGAHVTTQPARASVVVGRGVFSTRQIIIGRVFTDANGNGLFDQGERGVAGVRLYMQNGQSVITDDAGQYNFPAVSDGAVVVALDPTTLPLGYSLADGETRDGRSWTRLLRTPLGGGGLLRQNFALHAPNKEDKAAATPNASTNANADAGATQTISNRPQPSAQEATRSLSTQKASFTSAKAGVPVAANDASRAPGTYEVEASNTIEPVAPGAVQLVTPAPDEVIQTPALTLEARVAENWTIAVEVERTRVDETNIGERRVDHKNKTTTLSFVGINLKPGPNRLKVMPVSPDGVAGQAVEQIIYGRGPAVRLEVFADKKELQANGRDSTVVRVRALDQWNHPAADTPVALEVSAGRLLRNEDQARAADKQSAAPKPEGVNATAMRGDIAAQPETGTRQQIISLAGGEAAVKLIADHASGTAELRASAGTVEASAQVRFTPELRSSLMVGLAEVSVGRAAPENELRDTNEQVRSHVEFFYRGRVLGKNLLTLAYDSQRPLNRTAGRDRLFQLDPMERAYPLFGDTSTRYEDAPSNSKVYARLDRARSYAMFGDFDTEQSELRLAGYGRRLTGVKVHIENARGDFLAVTGARPDTAFTRDVFAAGTLGLIKLTQSDLLPGSETVTLEVRDRRNPELILSRETFVRSIDYNLDAVAGVLFLMRPVSAFDYALNLVQLVVTYEHRATGLSSAVYTARGMKNFARMGTKLGFSFVEQQQAQFGSFALGGLDGEQRLPHGGRVQFEWAVSQGHVATGGNLLNTSGEAHDGNAYRVELQQPLPFKEATLRASYARADAGFLNPFGATVTPGSQRATVSTELKLRPRSVVRFGLMDERNKTVNVNNERETASLLWTETFTDRLRATFGYDFRHFTDALNSKRTSSNLLTLGVEWQTTDKLQLSAKREQNLSEADPTYPNQTTLAATYQWNKWARLFFTQRLAAAPIVPISDAGATGFAGTNSRRETAIGVETKLGRHTSLNSRYQLEHGVNGTDSFAVIGLQNRLPISEHFALDLSFERGFHIAGTEQSFTGGAFGVSFLPSKDLRTTARYELREQAGGLGQSLTIGAAGRVGDGVTTLARFQWSRANFQGRETASLNGTAALALRPVESDRKGLLFSYTHRSLTQNGTGAQGATIDRSDVLSSDGYWQPLQRTEVFGRFALKFGGNGREGVANASALTYLTQVRLQQRLKRAFDAAVEGRFMAQPITQTRRTSLGAEFGYWALADMRVALGYNFTAAHEPQGGLVVSPARGLYLTISTKLSNLFDLFGTSRERPAAGETSRQDGGGK